MKWTIQELRKLRNTGNRFAYTADFDRFLSEDQIDIVAISPVVITGSFAVLKDPDEFVFEVTVQCILTMPCAITLADVEVPIDFMTELTFAEVPIDANVHQIEGITIDLDSYLWGEILIEKPMRVVAPGAYVGFAEEQVTFDEDDRPESANPFAKLKKPE